MINGPNGLALDLHGPYCGSRHDSFLLQQSTFLSRFAHSLNLGGWAGIKCHGDPAYPRSLLLSRPWTRKPYYSNEHWAQLEQENTNNSSARQNVEFGFGEIKTTFKFVASGAANLAVLKSHPANLFISAVILTNCHTCLYGNIVYGRCSGLAFNGVRPPSLQDYLDKSKLVVTAA